MIDRRAHHRWHAPQNYLVDTWSLRWASLSDGVLTFDRPERSGRGHAGAGGGEWWVVVVFAVAAAAAAAALMMLIASVGASELSVA